MPFEKVEFKFPDEIAKQQRGDNIEIMPSEVLLNVNPGPTTKSKAETDIEVEVVDDTPPQDRNRKPSPPPDELTDEELDSYPERTKKRFQHFSKGYHDERRRAEAAIKEREEAVRLARKLLEENNQLKESVNKNQEVLIEQAKARLEMELDQAKRAYKSAYESGDSEKVVAAQEALTAAKIKADKVATLKPAPLQKQETLVQDEPIAQENSVVDPKAMEWQKANSWFGEDDEMTSLALGLHQKLVREGVDTRSDEYYDRINRRMRELFPARFEDTEDTSPLPASKPRQSSPVAPASRSVAPKKITLTSTQAALARKLGVPLEEYARQVAIEMRKQNG
jgi:hypothetical protein